MKLVITPLGHLAIKDGNDYYIIDGLSEFWGIPTFTSLDFDYNKN
jgi:hypothetical protein